MFPNNSNGKNFLYRNLLKIKCIDFASCVYFSFSLMERKQNQTLQIYADLCIQYVFQGGV